MSIVDQNSRLAALVDELSEVALYLWQRGWAERNGGNISVNITDILDGEYTPLSTSPLPRPFPAIAGCAFLVTGTGKRMRDIARRPMNNAVILRLHPSGNAYDLVADYPIPPTSELPAHLAIHEQAALRNAPAKVVCHTHPTELVALTHHRRFLQPGALGRLLWSMIPETRIIVPRGVGIVPYELPGSLALANATVKALEYHDVVLWEKHGCLATGESLTETFDAIDTLAKSAAIYLAALSAGQEPEGLSDQQLDDLAAAFHLPSSPA